MIPAFSVIFFTVASGAGYGLLFWLAVATLAGWWTPEEGATTAACTAVVLGLVLVSAGLVSSTLHLGHPERAWRALTQWRSSWLSREGALALLSFVPVLVLAGSWWLDTPIRLITISAATGVLFLAPATVFTTAMIYASLKPIPRWSNPRVPAVYLAFSLASGGLLALALQPLAAAPAPAELLAVIGLTVLAWVVKLAYWRATDRDAGITTTGSATGLGRFGEVTLLESPHTSENYVLKEMGFIMARKHARKLRRLAFVAGAAAPSAAMLMALMAAGPLQSLLLVLAALSMLAGLVVERWLFFGEAKHVVTVFYGQRRV